MKAIVTGAGGFVGRHLIHYLLKNSVEVISLSRNPTAAHINYFVDPSDNRNIENILSLERPDLIFHLAGSTSDNEGLSNLINYEYCKNIINGIDLCGLTSHTKILVLGSAAEYGFLSALDFPATESMIENPFTLYGKNKLKQSNLILEWCKEKRGLGFILRPFSIIGPGMPIHLAVGNFENQIKNILAKKQKPIVSVGNIQARRDFIDVDDFSKIAFLIINRQSAAGKIYNVCSGKPTKISNILKYMIGLASTDIKIEISPSQLRHHDMPLHYGSNDLLLSELNDFKFLDWQTSVIKMMKDITV